MQDEAKGANGMGCPGCWPEAAEAAWQARRQLETLIVDESHFVAAVLGCASCGQRFLYLMTEMIDWVDGDDPQDWFMMPVTPDEARTLVAAGERGLDAAIGALDKERRSLHRGAPKGAPIRLSWTRGIWIIPHD